MARLICTACGARVSRADVFCPAPDCGTPLLADGATREADDPSSPDDQGPLADAARPPAGPGGSGLDPFPGPPRPAPPGPAPAAATERCPNTQCQAELPQPRPLWCIHCMQKLPPQDGPGADSAERPDVTPYGTVREVIEPRLILAFTIRPQQGPAASAGVIELEMGQQLLLSRESADYRLIGLRGKNNLSRRHATVGLAPYGAWVRDEGSTNGTYIDGRRLTPEQLVELPEGAELRLASNVYATVRMRKPGIGDDDGLG
jgi:hypothetical protein